GSRSNHNKETIELNPAVYIPGSILGTDARRPFSGFGSISMLGADTDASYDALQITARKRAANTVSLTAPYTLATKSHHLPSGGKHNDVGADAPSTIPWDQPGRHDFDRGRPGPRHRLVVSYVWRLPRMADRSGMLRAVLADWQWSGVMTAESGDPFTVTAGRDQSQTRRGQDRGGRSGPARGPGRPGGRAPGAAPPPPPPLSPPPLPAPPATP